jgi:CheY-like chemotaxis protein
MAEPIRILVVEDDPKWGEPIQQMYYDLLPKGSHVRWIKSGEEAVKLLKRGEKFDILSLDINLQSACTSSADSYADGRTILREAKKRSSCNAVIVITGLPYDESIEFITPIDRDKLVTNLFPYLQDIFGHNQIPLTKPRLGNLTIPDCIETFKAQLHPNRLLELCAKPSHGYKILIYDTVSNPPQIAIQKQGSKSSPTLLNGPDAQFVLELVNAREDGDQIVSKAKTSSFYYTPEALQQRGKTLDWGANRGVADFRRRIGEKIAQFNSDDILQSLPKKGYRLLTSTEVTYVEDSSV